MSQKTTVTHRTLSQESQHSERDNGQEPHTTSDKEEYEGKQERKKRGLLQHDRSDNKGGKKRAAFHL